MSRAEEPALERPGAAGQRRVVARAARAAFRALRRTPVGLVTEQPWFVQFRTRILAASVADVLAVLDALDGAGAKAWLVGGWGIDALLGTITRRHSDIDVLVSGRADAHARGIAALGELGYRVVPDEGPVGHWLPVRTVLRDRDGRAIEYLTVRAEEDAVSNGDVVAPAIGDDDRAFGQLAGTRVPCASASLQLKLHTGYVPKHHDHADVARLVARFGLAVPAEYAHGGSTAGGAVASARRLVARAARRVRPPARETAVVVPIPAAEAVTQLPGAAPGSVPAHVTVLYPFVPVRRLTADHVESLRRLAAATVAFPVTLAAVGRFPGVLYLAPDGDAEARLVELTRAVTAAWPAFPPYGGRFPEIVPHTTVYEGGAEPPGLEAAVTARLPIHGSADSLWLIVQDDRGSWTVRERMPFARPPG